MIQRGESCFRLVIPAAEAQRWAPKKQQLFLIETVRAVFDTQKYLTELAGEKQDLNLCLSDCASDRKASLPAEFGGTAPERK